MKLISWQAVSSSFLFICLCAAFETHAQTGWKWGISSVPSDNYSYEVSAAAIDDSGNVLTAGFTGFGHGDDSTADYLVFGTDSVFNPGRNEVQIVVKTDSNGHYIWAKGSQHAQTWPLTIATDKGGDVYVFGLYFDSSSCSFDAVDLLNPSLYAMYYLVKYSASGSVLWARNVAQSASNSPNSVGGLGIDNAGNIYVTGTFSFPSITIGSATLMNTSAAGDTFDVFMAKYDPLGNPVWAKSFGGNRDDYPNTIAVSASAHIYVTGNYTSAALIIGSDVLTDTLSSFGYPWLMSFITKFDSSGNEVWAKELNSKLTIRSTAIGDSENIYMTGDMDSDVIVAGDTLVNAGNADIFLSKYDSSGKAIWANGAGSIYNDHAWSIALDNCNNVWIAAMSYNSASSISFNGHTVGLPAGCYDPSFFAEYSSAGVYDTSIVMKSGGEDFLFVGSDKKGSLYLAGDYADVSMEFGTDTLISCLTAPVTEAPLEEELFLAKYKTSCITTDTTPALTHPISFLPGDIRLFPNPAAGLLTIIAQAPINEVAISNLFGQTIFTRNYKKDEVQIDVSFLPSGVYFVKVNGSEVRKFVKE